MTDENLDWSAHARAAETVARRLHRPPVPSVVFTLLGLFLDFLAVIFALWFAAFATSEPGFAPGVTLLAAALCAFGTNTMLWGMGAYDIDRQKRILVSGALAWATAFAAALTAGSLGAWPQSSLQLGVSGGFLATGLALSRTLAGVAAQWATDFGLTDRHAVIIGGGKDAALAIEALEASEEREVHVVGLFDDRFDERSPETVMGIPKLGAIEALLPFARKAHIDLVAIAFPMAADRRIKQVTNILRVLPVEIHLCGLASSAAALDEAGSPTEHLAHLTLVKQPHSRNSAFAKRVFDVCVAAAALVALSPVFLLVAIAIKLETRGPVFFIQKRHGYNNSVIYLFKFRSMHVANADPDARCVVSRNDPRVTRVGRLIRRTSLDELPQLFNVLKGDISLVGPRPHVVDARYSDRTPFEELVEDYAARHRVPPGITGWAQIHGWRGEIDAPERLQKRVEHDLYYIENRDFWLDLRILAGTVPALFRTDYAY